MNRKWSLGLAQQVLVLAILWCKNRSATFLSRPPRSLCLCYLLLLSVPALYYQMSLLFAWSTAPFELSDFPLHAIVALASNFKLAQRKYKIKSILRHLAKAMANGPNPFAEVDTLYLDFVYLSLGSFLSSVSLSVSSPESFWVLADQYASIALSCNRIIKRIKVFNYIYNFNHMITFFLQFVTIL